MASYIIYRLAAAVPVVLGVTLLTFVMVRLVPGDPVDLMFGQRRPSAEEKAELRHKLGLDRPIYVQLGDYLAGVAHLDFGDSIRSRQPVTQEILLRLPNTLKLTAGSLIVTIALGLAAGIVSAIWKGTLVDLATMTVAIVMVSIPAFWFGLMLILFFSLRLDWLPTSGAQGWRSLVLPSLALGLPSAAILARIVRASMLDVLNHEYVQTARAKGLSETRVVLGHAVRNAMLPIMTVLGFIIGGLLTGAFIIETVFAYPGVGMLAVNALQRRDFPVVQGIVLFTAVIYILVNLIVDLLYGLLDPRVRYA